MQYPKLLITFLILLVGFTSNSQNIQSPQGFLPTSYGERFTPHHLLVDYFEYVAANNPQTILQEYGRTNERRPLLWAITSSPENMKNLETIRTDNLKRAGLLDGQPSGNKPVAIIWLSYGVHGNEAGASESSMSVIYALANPDEKMKGLLENAVVIVDPSINPDGYSRYTHWNWNATNKIIDPDPQAREHNEPWPGGRVNHYLFDLNRDWAWQTQVETQQRLEIYQQWMPHIHVDYHEMGHNSPYYFAPAAQPYHDYITDWQGDFQKEIGKNHANYFDKKGWLYYTREIFDLFYPSYGDTYPIFNGAIGMTHEQAGHSMAGCAIDLEHGDTLVLQDRINHHFTTSISNIEIGAKNAERLTQQFADYFKNSAKNPPGDYKTFVIPSSNNADKIARLCRFLDKHKIRYGTVDKASGKLQGYHYAKGQTQSFSIGANDLVISAYQPKAVLTQVLFEPNPFLVDSLTYDITAWSLPHAYGLDAYALKQQIKINKTFTPTPFRATRYPANAYAYLANWQSLDDTRFLGSLLQHKIKVRFSDKSFTMDGKSYAPGTLVMTRADNRKNEQFDKIVQQLAQQHQRNLTAAQSGFATNGHDIGSGHMRYIEMPKVAIYQDDKVSVYSFGQVWYAFEQNYEYPITVINSMSDHALSKYNVLIIPEGNPKVDAEVLKTWVSAGGRLIAIGSAVKTLHDKKGFNLVQYADDTEKSSAKRAEEKRALANRRDHYGQQERDAISDYMPGAIFKMKLDTTHPLAFGMSDHYFSLKTSSRAYPLLKDTWNVAYVDKKPLILGFVGANAKAKMKETAGFAVQSMGSGSVIYMIDNPLFRGFWEQGKFLFGNAIFLAGQ